MDKIEIKERLERIKNHIYTNRKVYIAGAGCLVVGIGIGVASVLVFNSNMKVTQKAINAALVNWKPSIFQNQITIVDLPARGHRGLAIFNKTTGEFYASQNEAAKALGVNPSLIVKHFKGLCEDIHGNILINLGENLSEKVNVSV